MDIEQSKYNTEQILGRKRNKVRHETKGLLINLPHLNREHIHTHIYIYQKKKKKKKKERKHTYKYIYIHVQFPYSSIMF